MNLLKVLDNPFSVWPKGSRRLICIHQPVATYLHQLPQGPKVCMESLRKDFAAAAGTDYTCPLDGHQSCAGLCAQNICTYPLIGRKFVFPGYILATERLLRASELL
jgi:hypothetical protein